MPLISPDVWSTWANIPLTNENERRSVQMICDHVDKAVKKKTKRVLEQQAFTDLIFDAPTTPEITLGRYAPITISTFQCYLSTTAQGNPSAFTSDNLLTMYTDYTLDTDPNDPLLSPGLLRRVGNIWGMSYRRRPNQLAFQYDPNFGAVKLSFTGGYETIPDDIIEACCLLVSMIMNNRKYGFMVGSENWNGYSYNIPGVGLLVNGLMGNPDVLSLLQSYMSYSDMIG